MTPEDVQAIRADHSCLACRMGQPCKTLALCDALEAAWAERDTLRADEALTYGSSPSYWRERAERAEAVIDAARAVRNYYAPKFKEPPATAVMRDLFDAVRALDQEVRRG